MRDKVPTFGRIKPKWNPRPNAAETRYHVWAREGGCEVCKREASIHHVTSNGKGRQPRNHWHITPLCPYHHKDGKESIHQMGHDKFTKFHGIDLHERAIMLLKEYNSR